MTDIAIRVENLGKRYRIGARQRRHDTLRDALMSGFQRWNVSTLERSNAEYIWALKDVSFEIKRGEVVGIIGRNGAGKSTLLKILSRITKPTEGLADIHGRMGTLLEVGTGFHPELTGRENIYLSGAIMGMKKAEIERKFDEIVAFAEVDKFIDTPVKHYSSGMYVRLAFAVAAHLEPEILLVDEVLAVGDAAFQKKCLGKMGDVAKEGRTVLFVSHNMGAIEELCGSTILFQTGMIRQQGSPENVIPGYLSDAKRTENGLFDYSKHPARGKQYEPLIQTVVLRSPGGEPKTVFCPDDALQIEMEIIPSKPIREPRIACAIEDYLGRRIMTAASYFCGDQLPEIDKRCWVRCTLPRINLGTGHYLISLSVATKYAGLLDSIDAGAWFEIGWRNNYGNGEPYSPIYGPVLGDSIWETVR